MLTSALPMAGTSYSRICAALRGSEIPKQSRIQNKLTYIMEKKLGNVLVLFTMLSLLIVSHKEELTPKVETTRAFGDLTADFGVAYSQPLFQTKSIAPGESEVKMVTLVNEGTHTKLVFGKGFNLVANKTVASLSIRVEDTNGVVHEERQLTAFLHESSNNGIELGTLAPGMRKTFFIIVNSSDVGQKSPLSFDMTFNAIDLLH